VLPARKDELLPDSHRDLLYISDVITTVLSGAGTDWTEIMREFEDERNYLSISAAMQPGDDAPYVQVEFGVQDEQVRHATGGLVARWSHVRERIEGMENVLIDGTSCDISTFAERLATYVELPASIREMVIQE